MDYTQCVKSYYTTVIKHLSKYKNYYGSFANLNYDLDVPENETHFVDRETDFLPNFDLNINANLSSFENFLEYYKELMPDLAPVFLGKENIVELYNKFCHSDNDIDVIKIIVETTVLFLASKGVIK